jgi:type VII secretion integral membrane protein EccD
MPVLAFVTVDTPQRRLDVALPAHTPVAEVMPMLIEHGGSDLAQRGLAHGGWLLRKADGVPLRAADNLDDQGVRDGDVLSLVQADRSWPTLSYDDVAVAISESPDRGTRWTPDASRWGAGAAGAVFALIGCVAAVRAGQPAAASAGGALALLAVLALVLVAMAARRPGYPIAASSLAVCGLPIALTSGLLLASALSSGPARLTGAGVAGLVYALLAAVAGGGMSLPSIAGAVLGAAAVLSSVVWTLTSSAGAAAVTLGVAALGSAVAPAIGVRVGGLPGQRLLASGALAAEAAPDHEAGALRGRERLATSVVRTDNVILGLAAGLAAVALAAGVALASGRGWPPLAMACTGALAFALRARHRVLAAHRLAGLVAAVCAVLPAAAVAAWHGRGDVIMTIVLVGGGMAAVPVMSLVARAGGSPYLARAGDLLEMAAFAAIVPLACANAGLFQPFIGG